MAPRKVARALNWLNLLAGWWFVPLGGAIFILYLLKMRRRELVVPASFLWPARTTEVRANALFQKPKFNWLMVLQLLALLGLIAALMRPQILRPGLEGTITLYVMDASASMASTHNGNSRLKLATDEVRKAIDGMHAGERIGLILAANGPELIFPLSSDPSEMRRSLGKIRQTAAKARIGESMRLAAALVKSEQSARIVLLTDGCFENITNFSPGKAQFTVQKFGTPNQNFAITALATSASGTQNQGFCAVQCNGPDGTVPLSLYANGKLFKQESLTISSGSTKGVAFTLPKNSEIIEAKLTTTDSLALDNQAATAADPRQKLRVLLVTPGSFFLEKALAIHPRVELSVTSKLPTTEKGSGTSDYDLVVFDGESPEPVRANATLAFIQGNQAESKASRSAEHPLMRAVDLEDIFIEKAAQLPTSAGAKVLLEGSTGALITYRASPKQVINVGFRPGQSDWPLDVSFPIFIANVVDFLVEVNPSRTLAVQTGTPLSFSGEAAKALITSPSGKKTELRQTAQGFVTPGLEEVGAYTLQIGNEKRTLYASMLDPQESNNVPRDSVQVGSQLVKTTTAPQRSEDLWRWPALFATLLLCLEWWAFVVRS